MTLKRLRFKVRDPADGYIDERSLKVPTKQAAPDAGDMELSLYRCPQCNQNTFVPTDKWKMMNHGSMSQQWECMNPECINNPNSRAFRDWELSERMGARKLDDRIEVRHGMWRF